MVLNLLVSNFYPLQCNNKSLQDLIIKQARLFIVYFIQKCTCVNTEFCVENTSPAKSVGTNCFHTALIIRFLVIRCTQHAGFY